RFMREARAISRLNHPNIVRVYDYGEDPGGAPYIAMEYLDGTPLSDLREQPMPVPLLLEITDQVLAALAYIHARRIIHRDVKPENVIIQTEGSQATAKLLDFGFARVEEDQDARLSQTRMETFGTPTYMAPEQATGKGVIGPPTDIYALGVMLWQLLTLRPPPASWREVGVMDDVAEGRFGIPKLLERALRKAMAVEPSRRFQSAGELREELEVAAADLDLDVVDYVAEVERPASASASANADK
ncbi:MAG: serine/threonine protein kinase, partial [Myxococcales bacterium]|nr:serine/threonine protein kinase [Myxococcales bacterium]